jgi:hypothetical protein
VDGCGQELKRKVSMIYSERSFVPIADIAVFHNERPLSDAERNE